MDEKQRKVIKVHRNFLEKNIVWTDDLVSMLKEEGFITESLLRETQNIKSREEKVSKFIDLLLVRSVPKAFERLCDVLHATGHCFVSEFLRDAELQSNVFNPQELYQKMKFLEKLKDHEKKDLENFFLTKFREESLKLVWKDDIRDKEKAVEAKRQLIEQYADHKQDAKKWTDEMMTLEEQLESRKGEVVSLNAQIKALNQNIKEITEKHRGDINSQLRYTYANESQLSKANEKLEQTETMLRAINLKLTDAVRSMPRDMTKREEGELVNGEFAYMKHDMERLLEKHEELREIGMKYIDLCDQRDYILTHMGYEPQKENAPTLLEAYRDFAAHSEETMTELRGKLTEYGEMVETHKRKMQESDGKKKAFQMGANVWQAAIMNVMRQQLQDVKRESRIKDSRIQMVEGENQKMKAKLIDLEDEVHKLKRSKSKETKASREYLSIEHLNGPLSITSDASDHFEELDADSDTDNHKTKKLRFPPLNKGSYQAPTYTVQMQQHQHQSPRKHRVHHIEGGSNKYSSMNGGPLPDGLTTSTVRLERRGKYMHSSQPHGLGDLKAMNARSKFEKSLNPAKVKY